MTKIHYYLKGKNKCCVSKLPMPIVTYGPNDILIVSHRGGKLSVDPSRILAPKVKVTKGLKARRAKVKFMVK